MSTLIGGSTVLFAILCLVLNASNAEERIAFRKHWNFTSGSQPFLGPVIYRSGDEYQKLIYVLCDAYKLEDYFDESLKSERNCTVVQDAQTVKSCPVTLQALKVYMDIFPFGSTKAVIVWSANSSPTESVQCIIADFTTGKSKYVVLEDIPYARSHLIHSTNFVDYGKYFELVVTSNVLANSAYYNKYRIDADGIVIEKLAPWKIIPRARWTDSAASSFLALVADSKPKAYVQFTSSFLDLTYQISLLRSDGSTKQLAEFPQEVDDFRVKVVSTDHETIGVALPVEKRVNVWFFDYAGKLKLNASIQYDITLESLGLRNLADGGFLLFVSGSKSISDWLIRPHTCSNCYYLTKFDARGKVLGTIKMEPEPNCKGASLTLQALENDSKEYCVVISCALFYAYENATTSSAKLDELVKCFTDEDFTKTDRTTI